MQGSNSLNPWPRSPYPGVVLGPAPGASMLDIVDLFAVGFCRTSTVCLYSYQTRPRGRRVDGAWLFHLRWTRIWFLAWHGVDRSNLLIAVSSDGRAGWKPAPTRDPGVFASLRSPADVRAQFRWTLGSFLAGHLPAEASAKAGGVHRPNCTPSIYPAEGRSRGVQRGAVALSRLAWGRSDGLSWRSSGILTLQSPRRSPGTPSPA